MGGGRCSSLPMIRLWGIRSEESWRTCPIAGINWTGAKMLPLCSPYHLPQRAYSWGFLSSEYISQKLGLAVSCSLVLSNASPCGNYSECVPWIFKDSSHWVSTSNNIKFFPLFILLLHPSKEWRSTIRRTIIYTSTVSLASLISTFPCHIITLTVNERE